MEIDEEDKAVILLNSLPREEYGTFTLTLINRRKSLNYSEVSTTLVSYEVKRQDKLFSSGNTTAEALAVRGKSCYFVSKSWNCLFLSSSSFSLAIRVKERVCTSCI